MSADATVGVDEFLATSDYDEKLTVLTVDVTLGNTETDLDFMLDQGVLAVVRALTVASHGRGRRVALDLRVGDGPDVLGGQEAMVHAVRSLVQAYVREMGERVQPVNLLVSRDSQELDRELTWEFLADSDGTMARGATFDIREGSQ